MKKNIVKRTLAVAAVAALAMSLLAGCGNSGSDSAPADTEAAVSAAAPEVSVSAEAEGSTDVVGAYLDAQQSTYGWKLPDWYEAADEIKLQMAELSPEDLAAGKVFSHEDATLFSDVSADQAEQLKAENLKAVICMRWTGSFWPNQQIKGITEQLAEYGIDVIATTDANSDEATQIANIEQAIAMNPDGVYTKDSGEILIDGEPVNISTADDAQKAGVSMIFQEFSLLPTMTVAQNIFIKRESTKGFLLDAKADDKKAEKLLEMLSIGHIKPTTVVSQLSVGYQQMVEIAKALSKEAKILVMDEPTASLSQSETETLFRLIDELKKSGLSIIYISHRMEEVFAICDRVTVLRDGKNVLTSPVGEVTMDEVISKMLNVESQKKAIHNSRVYTYDKEPILEVENFSYPNRLDNISFKLYPGEILGIAGLMASGRTEIVESIFGIRKKWTGIVIMGMSIEQQYIVTGAIIVLAVAFGQTTHSKE